MYLFSSASSIAAVPATRLYGFSGSGSEPGLVTCARFGWNFMANSTAISSRPAFRKVNKLVNGTKQYKARRLYKMFSLGLCETWYIVLLLAKISSLNKARFDPKEVHVGYVVDKVELWQSFYEYFSFPSRITNPPLLHIHVHLSAIDIPVYILAVSNKLQEIKKFGHRILI